MNINSNMIQAGIFWWEYTGAGSQLIAQEQAVLSNGNHGNETRTIL